MSKLVKSAIHQNLVLGLDMVKSGADGEELTDLGRTSLHIRFYYVAVNQLWAYMVSNAKEL